jgi:hypothetical protein
VSSISKTAIPKGTFAAMLVRRSTSIDSSEDKRGVLACLGSVEDPSLRAAVRAALELAALTSERVPAIETGLKGEPGSPLSLRGATTPRAFPREKLARPRPGCSARDAAVGAGVPDAERAVDDASLSSSPGSAPARNGESWGRVGVPESRPELASCTADALAAADATAARKESTHSTADCVASVATATLQSGCTDSLSGRVVGGGWGDAAPASHPALPGAGDDAYRPRACIRGGEDKKRPRNHKTLRRKDTHLQKNPFPARRGNPAH